MEEQNQSSNQEEQKSQENSAQENQQPMSNEKDIEENKLWAFLGYLGLLCLIPLLAKKDSKFAQFHAKQGLILLIASVGMVIPFINIILGIAIFVLWIMGIINVFSGKMKKLPIVGDLAEKLNI